MPQSGLSGRSRHGTSETIGDEGNRTLCDSVSKTGISGNPSKNGTQDGTPKGQKTPKDPDLILIETCWSDLPEHIKAAIRRLASIAMKAESNI